MCELSVWDSIFGAQSKTRLKTVARDCFPQEKVEKN